MGIICHIGLFEREDLKYVDVTVFIIRVDWSAYDDGILI